ncbi:MAG: hypothetical protein WC829_13315 [Hyphomicrobium sp.]
MGVPASVLAEQIISLLPEDGTPVVNRIMRAMLSKRLSTRIDAATYFEAIEQLAGRNAIGRARGRGGSIFLASEPPTPIAEPAPRPTPLGEWSEAQLMAPTKRFLEKIFSTSLDLPPGAAFVVTDTSTTGPREGQWARPDFILVSVMRFQLLPGSQLDVHSFELKTEAGGSVQAVHEALAQTRFTNFGHLVWHVPFGSRAEAKLPEIETHCKKHGIGLIVIRDPNDIDSWETFLDAIPKKTSASTIDAFLTSRLPPAHRDKIVRAVLGD